MKPNDLLIAFYATLCSTVASFRSGNPLKYGFRSSLRMQSDLKRPSGYIPPEMDPEYRGGTYALSKIAASRTNVTNSDSNMEERDYSSLPTPKEGDAVSYKGKFGATQLGKIRFLQYIESYDSFFIDIVPLKESKTPQVFIVDRGAKAEYLPITEVKPVKFYFIRAEDGYKVYFQNKNGTQSVVLRAEQYRPLDKTFVPKRKSVDFVKLDNDFKDYEDLKNRVKITSLQIGAAISVLLAGIYGIDLAVPYSLGVLGACAYFILLSKKVDGIGLKYSALQPGSSSNSNNAGGSSSTSSSTDNKKADDIASTITAATSAIDNSNSVNSDVIAAAAKAKFNENVSKLRFLVPIFLVALLTTKEIVLDDYHPTAFRLLPQGEFISAMAGFLTLRLSIFLSEVAKEFRAEDIVGILPGSAAMVLRKWLLDKKEAGDEVAVEIITIPRKVLFITGPAAAGRYELIEKVFDRSVGSKNGKSVADFSSFKLIKALTTLRPESDNWFDVKSAVEFSKLQMQQDFFYEGIDRDTFGRKLAYAIPKSNLAAFEFQGRDDYRKRKDEVGKEVTVIVGPPTLLDRLQSDKQITLTTIWVSLQSKDQFIKRAQRMLLQQPPQQNPLNEQQFVNELVEEAAKDVSYFMEKASGIDHTILNSEQEEQSAVDEIRQLMTNLKS